MILGFVLLLLASALFVWMISRLSRRNPHDPIPLLAEPKHPLQGAERWAWVPILALLVPGFYYGGDLGLGPLGYLAAFAVAIGPGAGAVAAHNNAVKGH